ncbi:10112_t:CDS:2, partial [Paraglomus occultum]
MDKQGRQIKKLSTRINSYESKKGCFRKRFLAYAMLKKFRDENQILNKRKQELEHELTNVKEGFENVKKEYEVKINRLKKELLAVKKKASTEIDSLRVQLQKRNKEVETANTELRETQKRAIIDVEIANNQLREAQITADNAVNSANAQVREMELSCRSAIKKYRNEALKYQAALGNQSYAELSDEDPNNCTRYENDVKRFRHHLLQLIMPTKHDASNPRLYQTVPNFIPDYKIETMQSVLVKLAICGILKEWDTKINIYRNNILQIASQQRPWVDINEKETEYMALAACASLNKELTDFFLNWSSEKKSEDLVISTK